MPTKKDEQFFFGLGLIAVFLVIASLGFGGAGITGNLPADVSGDTSALVFGFIGVIGMIIAIIYFYRISS